MLVKQHRAGSLLERAQALAHRRRGQAERIGGAMDAAGLHRVHEGGQIGRGQRVGSRSRHTHSFYIGNEHVEI
jgi:hypothetical protein